MGRKIPAKKHRGVKDPLAQQAKRWQSLKGKINAPPKDPDEQPVPRSLTRLFGLETPKTNDKAKKKKHNINNHNPNLVGNKNAPNPVAKLRRLPGETGRSFSLRINGAVRALNDPAEELHYPLDTEEDDVKGERMEDQRRRRERKRRRRPTAPDAAPDAAKLTRGQKLTLKKKAKKLKQTENSSAREVVYERVGFGEVAHAPPALRYNARNASTRRTDGAPRPGRRDLLLNSLLQPSRQPAAARPPPAGRQPAAAPPPPADRLRLERARQHAIDAYRALKAGATPHRPPVNIL